MNRKQLQAPKIPNFLRDFQPSNPTPFTAKRQDVDLVKLTGGGLTGNVESSKLAGGSYEDKMNAAAPAGTVASAAPVANGGGGTSALFVV